jgi:hypothetical protein
MVRRTTSGGSSSPIRPAPEPELLRHAFGHHERVAVAVVEPGRDGSGQLQMLALVVAHRHLGGVVQQDVRGHQHRIGEQAEPHRPGPRRLLLELDHPGRLPVMGHAFQQVVQLGVLGDLGLHDQGGARRIDAGGEQHGGLFEGERPYRAGVVLHGHRMQIGDHRDRLGPVLRGDQRADGAQQVAELQVPGGLETGEAAGPGESGGHGGCPFEEVRGTARPQTPAHVDTETAACVQAAGAFLRVLGWAALRTATNRGSRACPEC